MPNMTRRSFLAAAPPVVVVGMLGGVQASDVVPERLHVVEPYEPGQPIRGNVVAERVDEIELGTAVTEVHDVPAHVHRLKGRVVGHLAVVQRETPWLSQTLTGPCATYNLRGPQELPDLLRGQDELLSR